MRRVMSGFRGTKILVFCTLAVLLTVGLVHVYAAQNTGGYPWADAAAINVATYDWGYAECQPPMRATGTCNAHNRTQNKILYHESDPWNYDVRNCTSYVAWREYIEFGAVLGGWGDARHWDVAAAQVGYVVDSTPRPGDIGVWHGGYGHVAYVTDVNADGSVNVDQYNRRGSGEFSHEAQRRADAYVHVHKPRIPEPVATPVAVATSAVTTPVMTAAPAAPIKVGVDDVSYVVGAKTTKAPLQLVAIHHQNTTSGKAEVVADGVDGSWQKPQVTSEPTHPAAEVSYTLADYDHDGVADLFQISHNNTASGLLEVKILSGASSFATEQASFITSEPTRVGQTTSYHVADYNYDGRPDIYAVTQSGTASKHVEVKIFNGAMHYSTLFGSWVTDEPTHSADEAYYSLGDHDGDGVMDVYQVLHFGTQSGKTEVSVLDGGDHYIVRSDNWQTEDALYKGGQPDGLPKL